MPFPVAPPDTPVIHESAVLEVHTQPGDVATTSILKTPPAAGTFWLEGVSV